MKERDKRKMNESLKNLMVAEKHEEEEKKGKLFSRYSRGEVLISALLITFLRL